MGTGKSPGDIFVKKVNENDDWSEEKLDASDIPVTTTGSAFSEAGISGSTSQSLFESIASALVELESVSGTGSLNFLTGTDGNDFNIVSSGTTHTFHIPDANLTKRGLVTAASQSFAGNKLFNGDVTVVADLDVLGESVFLGLSGSAIVDLGGGLQVQPGDNCVRFTTSSNFFDIQGTTAAGNDTKFLRLSGAGDVSTSRGAFLILYGNDHDNNGSAFLYSGDEPGSEVRLRNNSSDGSILFDTDKTTRWIIDSSGHLLPGSDNSHDIGTGAPLRARDIWGVRFRIYINSSTDSCNFVRTGSASAAMEFNSASTRVFNISNAGSGSAELRVNNFTVNVPFTGVHFYQKDEEEYIEVSDPVKLVNKKIVRCNSAKDPSCIGVLTGQVVTEGYGPSTKDSLGDIVYSGTPLYCVASVGDSVCNGLSGVKVCDEGGTISGGDYLCTSSLPGYLMKQSEDYVKNYTVAWCPEDVEFDVGGVASGVYVYLNR